MLEESEVMATIYLTGIFWSVWVKTKELHSLFDDYGWTMTL